MRWTLAMLAPFAATAALAIAPTGLSPLDAPRLAHRAVPGTPTGWQGFAQEHPQWRSQMDAQTGTALRALGPGLELPSGPQGGVDRLEQLLRAYPTLLGPQVFPSDLLLTVNEEQDGIGYIVLQQLWGGLEVVGGRVQARTKFGRMPLFSVETIPDIQLSLTPRLVQSAARERAQRGLFGAQTSIPELVILPDAQRPGPDARLAWRVEVRIPDQPVHFIAYIDAEDGQELWRDDRVRWAAGVLSMEHDLRTVTGSLVVDPIPFLDLEGDVGATAQTDGTGSYDTGDASTEVTAFVSGRNVVVNNHDGPNAQVTAPAGAFTWTDADATLAELDVYFFANTAREYARSIAPNVSWLNTGSITAKVNRTDGSCNAYFDGDINFYKESNTCNNTARIADVVYHEFGHGFHGFSITSGSFDGALSEGVSDYFACTMLDDPCMGPGFFTGSNSCLRRCDNTTHWPEDVDEQDPHGTGQIIAATLWDLRTALVAQDGYEAGVAQADAIFVGILRGANDIPSTLEEALLVDDDDGDLSNGTPNVCLITQAWDDHGIGPSGGPAGLSFTHRPLQLQPASKDSYTVAGRIELLYPQCAGLNIDQVKIQWQVKSGESGTVPATLNEGAYTGELPAAPAQSLLRYRIEASDAAGTNSRYLPELGSTEEWFQFRVGPVETIWCENFEDADPFLTGWDHALDSGSNSEGADDWQWGQPAGLSGDPDHAYSGERVIGNDLGGGNFNGAYQNGKVNHARGPTVSTVGYSNVHLTFRRWLNVEDGKFDHAIVKVNGREVWTNAQTQDGETHHQDTHWYFHDIDISSIADDNPSVRVRFDLETDEGFTTGGWTLDDVCIVSLQGTEEEPEPTGCDCKNAKASQAGSGRGPLPASLALLLLLGLRRRQDLP